MSQQHYIGIPLADKGFVPVDPVSNPVRWYVQDDRRPLQLLGPYRNMAEADADAARLNASEA